MKRIAFVGSFLAALLLGCTHDSSSHGVGDVFAQSETLPGFIQVNATGKSVQLGTDDVDAKTNERPRMNVSFNYDFALGRSEVTCGQYNDVMSGEELPEGMSRKIPCEDDSLPAVHVTFYDALLFANALSKSQGKDTVYSYQAVTLDADGHCVGLVGLSMQTDVDGYRLPTEAEWVYSAEICWKISDSWNSDNSEYHSHKVCELVPDSLRFCDLEGNVKEFVNDWLGNFADTTLYDFMGAPQGDALGQRVLKGGSFKHGKEGTKLYHRGDDYVVTSSTRSDYVGFRLASGRITNPTWMNNGQSFKSNSVSLVNSLNMKKMMGCNQTKLVYRNDITGNLEYIDYSIGASKIYEITDAIDAYHPDISPDGNWVAFSTGMEGVASDKGSELYVRRLGSASYDLERLDVESAAIPRWRVTADGDTVIVYVTSGENNSNEAEFKKRSTWQVPFSRGKFGKPKKLLDGAYHGGISADDRMAVTGARLLRVYNSSAKRQESVWYNGEQACNVSLSKDGRKQTLFLDFGSKTGQSFDGKNYGVHERILVMDSTGTLMNSIPSPDKYSFDHSEWATSQYAVATLTNLNGVHEKIVLVDMTSGDVVDLVKGDEIWHPALWTDRIDADPDVDLDSAGVYLREDDSWSSVLMRYNMELLWRYHDSVNVAILGSSRPLYSVSPTLFSEKFFAVNFAHTPNSLYSSRDFLEKYLFTHLKNLKYIVLSLDLDFWWKEDGPEGDNFFVKDAPQYAGYVYDSHHDYWKDGVPENLAKATEKGMGTEDAVLYLSDRGRFLGTICNSWGGDAPEIEIDSTFLDMPGYIENSMKALEGIIEAAQQREISVIGVIFPQNPAYAKTGAFGRYGLRRSVAETLIQKIDNLSETYPNFVLVDENKMGNHDYGDEMAVDYDHLCREGVSQITARLDSVLIRLDKEDK